MTTNLIGSKVIVVDFGAQYGQAHRAPRARFAGVLGDRAVRRFRGRGARAGAGGHHLVGRAGERVRRGCAVRRPGDLRAGHPGARVLLRAADHGRDAGRHRGTHRGRRVRRCGVAALRRGCFPAVRRNAG